MVRGSCAVITAAVLASLLSAGCLNDNRITAPASPDGSVAIRSESATDARSSARDAFQYPLTVGNHWKYRSHEYSEARFVGYPPEAIEDLDFTTTFDLTCEEVVGDTRYVYERFSLIFSNGNANGTRRYWEDHRGLWRQFGLQPPAACEGALAMRGSASDASVRNVVPRPVDEAIARNPRRAAAWKKIQDQREAIERHRTAQRLLAYPLHPGRTWRIDGLRMTVEAYETVHLSMGDVPAWRIRIDSPYQGPDSHTHIWYGAIGMVQYISHSEERLDYGDGRIEIFTNDAEEYLESFQIADAAGRTAASIPR